MIYEWYTYVAEDGRIEDVHRRFETATAEGFARAGIDAVGFFRDRDNPNQMHYLVRFEDADARDRAWATFVADPVWIEAKAASEAHGPLLAERRSIELELTPYSPKV